MVFHHFSFGKKLGLPGLCLLLIISGCWGGTHARNPSAAPTETDKAHPASFSEPAGTPERIILNLTTTPATSQAVTWRTDNPVLPSQAQIAPATGFSNFDEIAQTLEAESHTITLGKSPIPSTRAMRT